MPSGVYIRTPEHIAKSMLNLRHNNWLGKRRPDMVGDKNPAKRPEVRIKLGGKNHHDWKGSKVSYSGLHKWVKKWLGLPKECVYCGVKDARRKDGRRTIQFANVSHKYKRNLTDWIPLCTPCHSKYDKECRRNLIS
jgi:hypothetical protein